MPKVTWEIEGQTRATNLGQGGRYMPGWTVAWVTSTGVHGDVFVPDTEYTTERVGELVAARVASVVGVGQLRGEV